MGFPLISCPGPRMIILISTDIPNSLLVGYNYKNCIAWLLVISTIYDPRFRFGESPCCVELRSYKGLHVDRLSGLGVVHMW